MRHRLEIHRGDAEARRFDDPTDRVIGGCVEVHRAIGPGLLESAHEECPCHELSLAGLRFERQKPLPVGLKAVDELLPLHEAERLTYLRLSGISLGLLINFNVPILKLGLRRMVNHLSDSSAPPRLRG